MHQTYTDRDDTHDTHDSAPSFLKTLILSFIPAKVSGTSVPGSRRTVWKTV